MNFINACHPEMEKKSQKIAMNSRQNWGRPIKAYSVLTPDSVRHQIQTMLSQTWRVWRLGKPTDDTARPRSCLTYLYRRRLHMW